MLDKGIQDTLLTRLQALPPEKLQAFDMEIGPNAAQVMLYDILPELDFLLLENVRSLEGHQYQPERVLAHMGAQEQMPPQGAPVGPEGPPVGALPGPPQGAPVGPPPGPPMGPPQELPPEAMPPGAFGGVV